MENSLKENSIDDTVSFQLVMAVDELCANIIEHSCTQKPDDFIQIELKKQKNQVVIKIIDKGNSFNPKEHCPLSVKDLLGLQSLFLPTLPQFFPHRPLLIFESP